jgi:hypothetical protein
MSTSFDLDYNSPSTGEDILSGMMPVVPQVSSMLLVNGHPIVLANALHLDFRWNERAQTPSESGGNSTDHPPDETIYRAANFVLLRLKTYMRGANIKPLGPTVGTWRLDYLTDEGSKAPGTDPARWDRSRVVFRGSLGVTPATLWNSLSEFWDHSPPHNWESLLLDAYMLLPEVGPAVVLAATGVETLISVALDHLYAGSSVPAELWTWINDRGDYRKEPSTGEQLDNLLRVVTGKSLKDDTNLWQVFMRLRGVRNNFVHTGRAVLKGSDVEISEEDARILLDGARAIFDWLYPLLGEGLRRPDIEGELQVAPQKRRR